MARFTQWAARMSLMLVVVAIGTVGAARNGFAGAAPTGTTSEGPAVPIGQGTARVLVRTDAAGIPLALAVTLSRDALTGLPTALNPANAEGQWEYALPMPAGVGKTGYQAVVVDWQPHGHPPPQVYTVPHFDFHFYMINAAEMAQVAFTGPTDPATTVADRTLVPAGYDVIRETAVDKMGVHAIDASGPEFHGTPFTATFIYGYYRGRLTFLEPMVAHAFFLTQPNVTWPVKTPARYSFPGYYPTRYSVRYDAHQSAYLVELGGLKPSDGAVTAQRTR